MVADDQGKSLRDIRVERRRLIAEHIKQNYDVFLTLAELEGNIRTIKALRNINNESLVRFLVD